MSAFQQERNNDSKVSSVWVRWILIDHRHQAYQDIAVILWIRRLEWFLPELQQVLTYLFLFDFISCYWFPLFFKSFNWIKSYINK
jgi:hypothetical protein